MEQRPALKFCVLLSAGIVAGSVLPAGPGLFFPAAVALFLAAIVVLSVPGGKGARGTFLFPVLVVSFGACLASVDLATVSPDDPAAFISPDTVTVAGSIAETAGRGPRSVRFVLECDSVSASGVTRALSGRILVVLTGRAAEAAAAQGRIATGRTATVRGPILGIDPPGNPGEVDWQAHYRLAGIRARIPVRAPGQLSTGAVSEEGFLNRFVVPARAALGRRIAEFIDDREARFLNGLVLGERNEVPSDLRADFITVGVMHLLAISGQQVVLVAMLIAGLLAVFRIPEKPRFIAVACALAYYVLLTGASPSVTRAGIMSVVMLGARVAQRKADVFNALGVAASAILLWDPSQLFDPGFLLSFSAVLAIVLLYPLVLLAAPGLTARCERFRLLDLAWKGTAVSLAAGLGTAPIVAYFFGRVSLVGFLANILIVPLSSIALVLGLLTLGASFVWEWLASVYGAAAELSARLTFRLVGFFADLPYASVDFRLSLGVLAAVYVILALTLVSAARKSWKPALFGLLVIANLAVYSVVLSRGDVACLRVTFLDIGQGDAAFVEFPDGRTMLVDAGPRTFSFDAGERTVVPFLRYREIDTIDYLVVSHPHGDHLGGVPAVMSAFPVGAVIEGVSTGRGAIYDRFCHLADSLRVPRLRMSAGDVVGRDLPARVYVLGPESAGSAGSDNLNESSVVLMVRYGTTSVIFPGDAEEGLEEAMVTRFGRFLDSDILKAGHHGSATSSSDPFVRGVRPAWTVISAGEGNKFGHPSPAVLERLSSLGSAIHRTDRSGAAVFESDGTSWTIVDWRR